MEWKKLSRRVYLFGFLFVIGLGVAFYFILGQSVRSSAKEELLSKQQIVARAQAGNLESFFSVFGDSVAVLAQLKTITSPSSSLWDLDAFVEQWRDGGVVDGIALIDKNGILKLNSNVLGTHNTGISLADRDYYAWVMTNPEKGEYFVGKPVISRLGASINQAIVPVASPVYQDGTLVGLLVAAVELESLTENYLELMKISEVTDTFLIGGEGDLLFYNNMTEDISMNLFDYLATNPFPGSLNLGNGLEEAIRVRDEGSLEISYLDTKTNTMEKHLVAYIPVEIGDQKWLLVMATPYQDLWNLSVPMYIRLMILVVFVFITVIVFGVVVVKEVQTKNPQDKEVNLE